MTAVRVLLVVLATAAARPQDAADTPPTDVQVNPKELAGDTTAYKLVPSDGEQSLEASARALLDELETQSQQQQQKQALAEWAYSSNITAENEQAMLKSRLEYARFEKDRWKQVTEVDWKNIKDEDVKRQFKILSKLGTAALPEDKLEKYDQIQSSMERTYSTARVCNQNGTKCDLSLEPDLSEIMANSRDPEELEHVWLTWRENTGKKMRSNYTKFVELINEAAELNGFQDGTELWLDVYDTADFQSQIARLWDQLTPLYEQLHAYVRGRLRKHYGERVVSRTGPIPAHLLGDKTTASWMNQQDSGANRTEQCKNDLSAHALRLGCRHWKLS